MSAADSVEMLLSELKLPSFMAHHQAQAEQGGWGFQAVGLLAEMGGRTRSPLR